MESVNQFSKDLQHELVNGYDISDIKLAYQAGLLDPNFVTTEAARHGYSQLLKWVVVQGAPLHVKIATSAALHGDMKVVTWLDKVKCPVDWTVCAWAGLGGHLEVLQHYREKKCEWNKWATANAARHNHRETFQWAYENDCPVSEDASRFAAVGGHIDMLKYIREIGHLNVELAEKTAIKHRQYDTIAWLKTLKEE